MDDQFEYLELWFDMTQQPVVCFQPPEYRGLSVEAAKSKAKSQQWEEVESKSYGADGNTSYRFRRAWKWPSQIELVVNGQQVVGVGGASMQESFKDGLREMTVDQVDAFLKSKGMRVSKTADHTSTRRSIYYVKGK